MLFIGGSAWLRVGISFLGDEVSHTMALTGSMF